MTRMALSTKIKKVAANTFPCHFSYSQMFNKNDQIVNYGCVTLFDAFYAYVFPNFYRHS